MTTQSQINSPLSIPIPRDPVGIPPELRGQFEDLYNALFQIQAAFVNYCGIGPQDSSLWNQLTATQTILQQNMNRFYAQATEQIAGGALVNLVNVGGVVQVRNANATDNTKPAQGFCNTSGGVPSGTFGEFILFGGLDTLISGMVPGTVYYLSTNNGLITSVKPVAAGNIEQMVGIALDANTLYFTAHYWIQH